MPSETPPTDDRALGQIIERLAARLQQRRLTLATGESCTGGWIAKLLTDRPGSSEWFSGGVVSYSNDAKQALLGVPPALLAEHGAVSKPVVIAMAEGARNRFDADFAIAVSGIAGPGGGSDDKPVGTVWLAWADPAGVSAAVHRFDGDRESIRRRAVYEALVGLMDRLPAARARA